MSELSDKPRDGIRILLLIVASLVVGALAITSQSLWMDEGSSAFRAIIPEFKEWLRFNFVLGGSDVQMPFYMTALWLWHKLGFTSEYALRCINLPFLILMVVALRKVRFWPLVCLTSPFVLYYVGELRPYTMQMAGGALAALGLGKIIDARGTTNFAGLHTTACASLLLILSSLSAAVWVGGLALGVIIIRPDWLSNRKFWLKSLPWICGGILIAAYYGYTILKGYGAAAAGGSSLLSIGFAAYEMLGLLGIGPTRNEIRASPMNLVHHLPWLLPAFTCLFLAWIHGVRVWLAKSDKRVWIGVGLALIVPILVLIPVSLTTGFQLLGRHFSPAIPAVLLPLAVCLSAESRRIPLGLAVGIASVVTFIVSSLILRLDPRHERDDYRKVTTIAIDAISHGKRILWQADMNATRYYAYRMGGMPYVNAVQQFESDLPGILVADLVVINRPDNRFQGIDYQADLRKNDFILQQTFTGFEIWKSRY